MLTYATDFNWSLTGFIFMVDMFVPCRYKEGLALRLSLSSSAHRSAVEAVCALEKNQFLEY